MYQQLSYSNIVTGASGFIGSHLVDALVRDGGDALAVDRREGNPPCRFVQAELSEPGVLDPHLTPKSVVFHLAANASVPGSAQDPKADFRDNVVSLVETLESARRVGCRVVFTSSAAVYDSTNELPLTETSRVWPTSPYGAAKVACEAYCAAYHRTYGMDVRIARLFNIYGPRMVRFAVFDFVEKIRRNPCSMEILGDGEQLRDYLYVADAVTAIRLVAEQGVAGETYNVGSGKPVRSIELAREVAAIMGHATIEIRPNGRYWPGDIRRWYADASKLRALGFDATIGLREGLRATVDWLVAGSAGVR